MIRNFRLSDYSISLGPLAETLCPWLEKHQYAQIFVVTDFNTHELCLPLLPITPTPEFIVGQKSDDLWGADTGSERFKTLATCQALWQAMLHEKLDRKALVINLGGGVIGDMGGFCAATFKRGVDFVQIPTTLLAMTDAAIGGKLGVNFQGVKNTIGVFQNPVAVFIDPVFLENADCVFYTLKMAP